MTVSTVDPLAVTPKVAGQISGLGEVEIRHLMDAGQLPFIWKGTAKRYQLVLVETLHDYLRSRQRTA